jgi:hypothetical protein
MSMTRVVIFAAPVERSIGIRSAGPFDTAVVERFQYSQWCGPERRPVVFHQAMHDEPPPQFDNEGDGDFWGD